jgi:Leucine-rich repeat (LRR) protein
MIYTLVARFAVLSLVQVLLSAVLAIDSIVDRNALADMYQAMGGAQWTNNANWLAPNVSMCSWYGVVCAPGACPTSDASVECRVAELGLGANGLQGAIAPAVLQLTNLTKLVLAGNALAGTIPSFRALTSLTWLDLNTAQLTGSIPEFETLVNLERIELFENHLEGTLPSFANSVRLAYLDLNPCYGLTGTIPPFSTLVLMQTLQLGRNQFDGSIPHFNALLQLRFLSLESNLLTGTIPAFETLVQMQYLYLLNNALTGTVPAFATLAQLRDLHLHNNTLTGTVPSFSTLTQLQELYLYSNQLTGTIPSFSTLTQLQILYLNGNELTGQVPSFASLLQLRVLGLYSNRLSGTLPAFASPQLYWLYLNNNMITGTVPAFSNLLQLRELVLSSNLLSGSVPTFAALAQLQQLRMDRNLLEGTVPAFSTLAQLQTLHLFSNSLSGTVPNFDSNPALQNLDLSTNQLSGSLPSFAAVSQLAVLRLARNRLTGSLPALWHTLRNLALIDVAENTLDGDALLHFHTNLRPPLSAGFFNLSFNRFGGVLVEPQPLETINLTSIDVRGNQFLCPLPLFSPSLRVLLSECVDDWAQLGTYAAAAAGAIGVGLALVLVIKRLISEQRFRMAQFSISWLISAISVLSDAYSYMVMVQYMQTSSGNCVSINEKRVFYPQISGGGYTPSLLQDVPGYYAFSNWITSPLWVEFSNDKDAVRLFTELFRSACRQAPECEYDAALLRCYNAYPQHQAFLNTVFAFIAIRAAFEFFSFVAIAVSCSRNSLVLSCRVWIKTSVFLPLLLMRVSTRASVLSDIVMADTPPSELIWELLSNCVFLTATKLFAQVYYLLAVAQTGLAWSNWLSLALGIVTVVRLVAQAAWSWRKTHHSALEEHYAERAASGSSFDLDDLGGSANIYAIRLP